MISELCLLWGFDGDFAGNEDRVFARLPIVKLPSSGQFAAADTLYWSPEHPENLTLFPDEATAAEAGTRLPVDHLHISPGQYVVLAGPDFLAKLDLLNAPLHASPQALLDDDWKLFLLNDAEYEDLCTSLLTFAREVFDDEVRTERNGLSRRAETALTLLRANPLTPLDVQQTRTLAARLIRRDAEGYRSTLELSAMRLQVPSAVLLQRLHEYLNILGRDESVYEPLPSPPDIEIANGFQRDLLSGPDPFAEPVAARMYVAALVQRYQGAIPAKELSEAVDQMFGHWTPDGAVSDVDSARLFTLFAILPTNEGFVAVVSYLTQRAELIRAPEPASEAGHRLLAFTLDLLIESEQALRRLNSRDDRVSKFLWDRFMDAAWGLLPFGEIGIRAYELLLQHVGDLSELLLEVLSNEKASPTTVKELFLRRTDGLWLPRLERCVLAVQTKSYNETTQRRLYEMVVPDAAGFDWEATNAFYRLSESMVPEDDGVAKQFLGDDFPIFQLQST